MDSDPWSKLRDAAGCAGWSSFNQGPCNFLRRTSVGCRTYLCTDAQGLNKFGWGAGALATAVDLLILVLILFRVVTDLINVDRFDGSSWHLTRIVVFMVGPPVGSLTLLATSHLFW